MSVMEVKEVGAKFLTEQEHSVIYVYADNCPPCQKYAPVFLNLSDKMPSIKFGKFKLPKDEPSEFKRKWLKVETGKPPYGTPTTLVFKSSELIGIHEGAILDENKLEYFVLNGKMPERVSNPAITALPQEVKDLALRKDGLLQNLKDKQAQIQNLTLLVDNNSASDYERIERVLLDEECSMILLELNEISTSIRTALLSNLQA